MTEWTEYADSAEGADSADLVSAEVNLDSAANQADWSDWHAETGDGYTQWAESELTWAEDCFEAGATQAGEQALANAAADLSTAGDEYADASWAASNAETYTEWAADDLASASYDSSSSYDSSASYDASSDSGY